MISVIVRTKNEERWMKPFFEGILRQKVDLPIEVVLVDNGSTDKTVERARSLFPNLKVVHIEKYLPGLALNEGIRESRGDYIVCVSAHCPAVDENWLANLLRNFESTDVAGVYGRQVPTPFSSAFDKRDLLNTFGLDRRVQVKDTFFHNANSMMPRGIWKRFPFDEAATNIEDRLWGQQVIQAGLTIVYEPEATVFHHHGIHQDNRPDRASNVVRILENQVDDFSPGKVGSPFDPKQQEIAAIVPLRASGDDYQLEEQLLRHTLEALGESAFVKRVLVSTDDEKIASLSLKLGAEVPFLRPSEFSAPGKRVDDVLQQFLFALEAENYFPDIIVPLEVSYPFRPPGLIDGIISRLLSTGFDSIIAGLPEFRACWEKDGDNFREITDTTSERETREPLHISVPGLATACLPPVIRNGARIGGRVGIYETDHPLAGIEIRTDDDLAAVFTSVSLRK